MCTFWLVEALTRAGKVDPARLDQSRLIFEKMLGYSNHLGLYSPRRPAHMAKRLEIFRRLLRTWV